MSWRINALINALCVKSGILRKSKIIKSKKYKNTVRPMFVYEMAKKIAKKKFCKKREGLVGEP